jgi:AraC-like DNA-binding protein
MRVSEEQVRHPDRTFRFLRFEIDAFMGERHRHRQLELTWIEAGVGLRFVGDDVSPFAAGDLVLLGSNVAHCWVSSKRRGPVPRAAATVIQFAPELLSLPQLPELSRLGPLAARARHGLAIVGRGREHIVDVLTRMRTAGAVARLAGWVEILGVLDAYERDFRTLASRPSRGPTSPAADPPGTRRIDQTLDWIRRHLARELTVVEAARIAHVTPAAFSRFFRREVGKTFTRYVNDVRCSEACLKLRLGSRPVAAVARECGYSTLSHFNRQFRLRHGMSPREFRATG